MKKFLFVTFFICIAISSWATQYGPYWINQVVPKPTGYTKVVCFSEPQYIGAGIYLVNVDTQEQVHLTTSAGYQPIWYYYIPAGTYEVVSIEAQNAKIKVNGFEVEVGDEVVFSSIDGSVIAIPDSE